MVVYLITTNMVNGKVYVAKQIARARESLVWTPEMRLGAAVRARKQDTLRGKDGTFQCS